MPRPRCAILALLPFLAIACSAPTTTLNLRVVALPDDPDAPTLPVAHARIRAVPVAIGTVPLPVTEETLRDFAIQSGVGAVSDEDGRARLRIDAATPYEIQVLTSPFHELAPQGTRRWRYDPTTATLRSTDGASPATGPWLAIVLEP